MVAADLVHRVRREAGLSLRALAEASGVSVSTIHRVERGGLNPTVEMLDRIVAAAGVRLRIEPRVDHALGLVGLALAIREDVAAGETGTPVRRAAELAHRFAVAGDDARRRMIAAEPPATGDARWDAFLGALAEWLAVGASIPAPRWVYRGGRYLRRGWWVTEMRSMQAWEYAGSPVPFKLRGVYLHRESLVNR